MSPTYTTTVTLGVLNDSVVVESIAGASTSLTATSFLAGPTGRTGPNQVNTTTDTNMTGILKGDGAKVKVAEAGTDYLAPNGNGSELTGITQSQVDGLGDALSLKAPKASPTFTGVPAVPTAAQGTDTTQIASTAFVKDEITSTAVFLTLGLAATNSDYVCDGTADNVEIQAALTDLGNAGGGVLYVRAGSYAIAAKLRIKSNVRLIGEDAAKVFFNYGANIHDTVVENYDTVSGNANIWIKNITINGNGSNNNSGYGLHLSTTTNCLVERVIVTSSRSHGILIDGTNSNNVLRDCSATGVVSASSEGIYINNSTGSRVERTKSYANPHHGFYIANSSYIVLDNVESYGNAGEGGVFWTTSHSTLSNSRIHDNASTGFRQDNGSPYNTFHHNDFVDNGSYALMTGVSAGLQNEWPIVTDNLVQGTGDDALVIDHSNYAFVRGNNIRMNGGQAGDQGLPIDNSAHSIIIGNRVEFSFADGIEIKNSSHYCTVSGNVVRNNSNPAVGGISNGRGIVVRDGIVGCSITGNVIFCDETPGSQVYGLELTGAGCDYNTAVGNTIRGNGTNEVHLLSTIGTHNVVAENSGADDGRMQVNAKMVNDTTGNGILIQQTGLPNASKGSFVVEAITNAMVTANAYGLGAFRHTHASSTNRAVWIDHAGLGEGLQIRAAQGKGMIIDNNGNAFAIDIDQDGNSSSVVVGMNISVANAGIGGAVAIKVDAPIDFNSQKGINVPTPVNATDLVNKAYADALTGSTTNWSYADQGLLGWSYDVASATLTSIIPSAGVMQMTRVPVKAGTITNIHLDVTTAGAGLTSAGVAIYQGGTLLAQSADISTTLQSTNGKTIPLSAPVSVTAGYVYVAVWANGTTLPTLARAISRSNVNIGLTSSTYRFATSGSSITTTAPGTLGILAAGSTSWWIGLS